MRLIPARTPRQDRRQRGNHPLDTPSSPFAPGPCCLLDSACIVLSRADYLTVQQIYRGWALLGVAVIGALISAGVLTWLRRGSGAPFYFALMATVLISLSLVVFFWFTFPA